MKKATAIKLLKSYSDQALNIVYTDRLFHQMLFVIEEMFGKESFAYTYLLTREPRYISNRIVFDRDKQSDHYLLRDEVIDHIDGCINILQFKKPYKAPRKNIFSNKENAAVLLAGLGVFFVGILVGSQLSPEVVSLMERIRNIFI